MKAKNKPNIVLIYTDQQRFDSLSCNDPDCPIETPNIDSIARTGRRFDKCFVQNPVCAPSRVSFLTGQYPSALRIGENGMTVDPETDNIANILHDYGYQTAQIGKLHFQPHANRDHRTRPINYGFDFYVLSDEPGCYDDAYTAWVERQDPEELQKVRVSLPPASRNFLHKAYTTRPRSTQDGYLFEADSEFSHSAFVASESERFLDWRDRNKPFFMISGFYAPHPPLNPTKEYFDSVDTSKLRLPQIEEGIELCDALKGFGDREMLLMRQYYYGLCKHVDDQVGRIIDKLKEQGVYDNTIIIFTTDHGEFLGDHGRIQKGMPGYDCITRVPMIVSYPEEIEPGVCESIIESVDIVPTLLSYVGVQPTPGIQGKNLRPLIDGKVDRVRETALTEYFSLNGEKEARIRSEHFSYYRCTNGKELLFDIDRDPYEIKDVSKDPSYREELDHQRYLLLDRMMSATNVSKFREAQF